ncbi:MAG: M1 family metallopeptidase [Bacteroidia bacterium]
MKSIFILAGFALACILPAQVKTRSYLFDPQLAPLEHNVDFKHLRLELAFVPEKGLVRGKATLLFVPLRHQVDSIRLDAPQIKVKAVSLNGKAVPFHCTERDLVIYTHPALSWEQTDSIQISYESTPRKGLYFIGWNDPYQLSRKQIWSQGQGVDNRCWIPMYDEMNDKMTTELLVTFNKDYQVLSNGTRLSVTDNPDQTRTWHYRMQHPHSPYLIMLAIGKYEIKETQSASGVPMHLYYYPEWKDRVETTYRYSEAMMDFFEKETGVRYGWEGYSQIPVQDYMFGAMENTTATVYGDFSFVDARSYIDRPYVGTNAHELAHQWFGDLVTARSDAHHWLQESFATYYNGLFEREVFGADYFDWARRDANTKSLEESQKNSYPVASSEAGNVRHYPKGAFVLNMLKYVCGGREAYNRAITYYLEQHKYGNVDSHDLLVAFEESLGFSLDWFWEEWILKAGEPDYRVTFRETGGTSEFTVVQSQELTEITGLPLCAGDPVSSAFKSASFSSERPPSEYRPAGLFRMPIVFEVYYEDGSKDSKQVWVEKQTELIRLPNTSGKKIAYVLFDPNNEVLKSVHFVKPWDMLKVQALKAEHMLDRYDAIVAMKGFPVDKKRAVLQEAFNKEVFHAIKSEIIAQLASDTDPSSLALFHKALHDSKAQVRRSVLQQVRPLSTLLKDAESMLRDSSYENIVLALDVLSQNNPSAIPAYLDLTKGVIGTVGRNVEIKWLELAWNQSKEVSPAEKLIAYCGSSYEFRTRTNAAQAVKRMNVFNTVLLENLVNAVQSPNGRLAGPCGETLKYFYEMDQYRKQISDYIYALKLEPWQLQAVRKYVN